MNTTRNLFVVLLGLFIAGLLIYLLIDSSGIRGDELVVLIKRPSATELLGIFLASLFHMGFGALKWQTIMTRIAPRQTKQSGPVFFLFYTALSATLAQFVMIHVASLLVRGAATRIHHRVPFVQGAAASVFEQVFDVFVMLLFACAGGFAWSLSVGPWVWGVLVLMCLIAGWLMLKAMRRIVASGLLTRDRRFRFLRRLGRWLESCQQLGLLDTSLIFELYVYATFRYLSMVARLALILAATSPTITLFSGVLGFTIVQTAQLLAVTPGSLGITEWTWAGFLTLLGYPLSTATGFSFALRILSYVSILAVLAVAALAFAIVGRRMPADKAG